MLEKPEENNKDNLHLAGRVVISSIPIFGGAALELFNKIIAPPIEKRKHQWMNDVTDAINKLVQEKAIDINKLKNNEQFINTILQASTIAIKNYQKEKLEALKNAVLNSALSNSPDESLQQIFLSYVDEFTIWHIKILFLFHNQILWFSNNHKPFPNLINGALSDILEAAYPELSDRKEFYELIWSDLFSKKFTTVNMLNVSMTDSGLKAERTSELGEAFLNFISSPL